jgi:two-component system phosphate regulon response regulator PhoB
LPLFTFAWCRARRRRTAYKRARAETIIMTKLLLVEDDADLGDLTKMSLEMRGYSVGLARNIEEAVAEFRRERPDVVILDYFLEGNQTGLDALKALKQSSAMEGVAVFFMSGLLDKEVQDEVFAQGASALLTKPLQFEALREQLQKVLRPSPAPN